MANDSIITPDDLKTHFPEFSTLNDAYIQLFIDIAALNVSRNMFKAQKKSGELYLTAHLLKLNDRNGQVGDANKIDVGDLSRGYDTGGATLRNFESTGYGQTYIQIRNSCVSSPIIA